MTVRAMRMAPSEPSAGSVKMISAPYAARMRLRSTETLEGMQS